MPGAYGRRVADDFTARYRDLLTGSYDCVDRIVLNAYYPMGNTAGGFRTWWRRMIGGSEAEADAPFAAQVILNGHEYVAVTAQAAGIGFTKEGNCFTGTTDPTGLAQIADTLSQDAAAGRLSQVIDRWTCTACLVFGLDLADQQRTCFHLRLLGLPGRILP